MRKAQIIIVLLITGSLLLVACALAPMPTLTPTSTPTPTTMPITTPTSGPTATPTPTTTPALSPERVIEDLAYIKILALGYSDDADPEEDGVALNIIFYDSKSEPITFRDISITVTIELFGYNDFLDTFDHEKMELVYQQQVIVNHSMRISEMLGKYIRIPFENIMVDQSEYYELGTIKVAVTTAKQGDFQDIQDFVKLYAED